MAVLATVLLAGCNPFRRAKLPPPPTPIPARLPDHLSSDPAPPPKNLPAPPDIEAESVNASDVSILTPSPPKARPPRPVRRRAARPKPAPAPPSESTEESATSQPVWKLGETLPPERRAALMQEATALNAASERILASAGSKQLTAAQAEMAERIRGFVKQSRDALEKSPSEALALAKRASVFAKALE